MSMQDIRQGKQTVNIGQPQEGLPQRENRRMPRRNNWSTDSDELLIRLLLEECTGNRTCSGSFSPFVWSRVFSAYINTTKEDVTLQQLKSRWKTLKKMYRLYSSLVNKSGWSWDYENHRPTPGDPTVWEELIQFNKEYKVARDKPFPLFWMIHELAGTSTATGRYASHTGCGEYRDTPVVDVAESIDSSGKKLDTQTETNTDRVPVASMKDKSKDASGSGKRKPVRNTNSSGAKRRSQEHTLEMVDKLVDLSTKRSIVVQDLKSEDDNCSYGVCIDKLASLPDITDEELFIGGKALRSRKDRIFFIKMRPSAQSYWLRAVVKEWYEQD